MLSFKDIPPEWVSMLRHVQTYFPNAKIAGGALRDLELGKEIKDVDIFITRTHDFHESMGKLHDDIKQTYHSEYGMHCSKTDPREIYGIYHVRKNDIKYEFIVGSEKETSIDLFDIGICQISFDGNQINVTQNYIDDVQNKIIRVYNPHGTNRTIKRIARMSEKFPDFTVSG